jgi:hypothetical protein
MSLASLVEDHLGLYQKIFRTLCFLGWHKLTQVHLNRDSPLIRQHHTNWRMSAIQSLMNDNKEDLHYSTVSTLSRSDAEKLRADMTSLIENYVAVVKPSKEEVMYGFNLDFFCLNKM